MQKSNTINHRETVTRVRKGRNTAGKKTRRGKKQISLKAGEIRATWIIHTVEQRTPGLGGGVMAGLEDLNNDGDIVSVTVHIV